MKLLKTIILLIITTATLNGYSQKNETMNNQSLYDIKINSLTGGAINLADFKGKYILFVNVASECGFTPQYADLEKMHEMYKDKLVIIGVPCNQFGGQEPGDAAQIQNFCQKNYGVKFLITEKVDVKGEQQHPLYTWLTSKEQNGVETTEVKWNFQKYLIDTKGNYMHMFISNVKPLDEEITKNIR